MLVLSRRINEEIQIGDNITIVVSRISGNRVSIGIKAPNDVSILRGELKADIEAEIKQEQDAVMQKQKPNSAPANPTLPVDPSGNRIASLLPNLPH